MNIKKFFATTILALCSISLTGCGEDVSFEDFFNEMNSKTASFYYESELTTNSGSFIQYGNVNESKISLYAKNELENEDYKYFYLSDEKYNETVYDIVEIVEVYNDKIEYSNSTYTMYTNLALPIYNCGVEYDALLQEDNIYNGSLFEASFIVTKLGKSTFKINIDHGFFSCETTINFKNYNEVEDILIKKEKSIYSIFNDELHLLYVDRDVEQFTILNEIDGKKIKHIATQALAFCTKLTSITLPDTIETIGISAFSYSYNIENVTLSANLKFIGASAFSQSHILSNISLPDGLIEIGSGAFIDTAITSLFIPSSVTTVGNTIVGFTIGNIDGVIYTNLSERPDGWSDTFNNNFIVEYNYNV